MKPLVSVIVPVYKVEPYLERCLDSLVSQTLKEIEIILIDDGSPDRCGEICDEYAAWDGRVRVVHQENRGLSAVRNVGLDLAQADYIMFVDSDDWVDPDFCRLPYEAARRNSVELVVFQYRRIEEGREQDPSPDFTEGIKTKDSALKMLCQGANMLNQAVWNKLYAKHLFSGIPFPEGRYFEDLVVTHRVIYSTDTVFFLRHPLYYYLVREGSIMQLRTPKAVRDRYELEKYQFNDLVRWGYEAKALPPMQNMAFQYLMHEGRYGEHSEECSALLLDRKKSPSHFSWRKNIMLLLLRYAPPLFDLVCILRGKRIR